jgi:hypothetical protein
MAEIVNLRLARKAKARDTAARVAAENRARHGTSKSERDKIRAETARAARQLDGNRRDPE